MLSYSTSAALIGIALAVTIVVLLRRDQLYLRDALFWLGTAAASLALAVFPHWVDVLGHAAGVLYPPALLLGLTCVVLTIKAMLSDIALTELRRDVRRLDADLTADRQSVGKSSAEEQD
jgi:hypothetical protein